jgi:hypothetical protein
MKRRGTWNTGAAEAFETREGKPGDIINHIYDLERCTLRQHQSYALKCSCLSSPKKLSIVALAFIMGKKKYKLESA